MSQLHAHNENTSTTPTVQSTPLRKSFDRLAGWARSSLTKRLARTTPQSSNNIDTLAAKNEMLADSFASALAASFITTTSVAVPIACKNVEGVKSKIIEDIKEGNLILTADSITSNLADSTAAPIACENASNVEDYSVEDSKECNLTLPTDSVNKALDASFITTSFNAPNASKSLDLHERARKRYYKLVNKNKKVNLNNTVASAISNTIAVGLPSASEILKYQGEQFGYSVSRLFDVLDDDEIFNLVFEMDEKDILRMQNALKCDDKKERLTVALNSIRGIPTRRYSIIKRDH